MQKADVKVDKSEAKQLASGRDRVPSALMPSGNNNVLTISVSQTQGDADDALRLELTNTSAAPSVRGWNDYSFVTAGTTGSVTVPPNDAVPNP